MPPPCCGWPAAGGGFPGARVELCIIPRSVEIDAEEQALCWSVVVSVTGTRPRIALAAVSRVVVARRPAPEGCFTAHRFWPDGFLLVFDSRETRDAVLAAGPWMVMGFP